MGKPKVDPEDLRTAKQQIPVIEAAIKALQECQAGLPVPTPEEIAQIEKSERSLTPELYRLGLYQAAFVDLERVSDDLRRGCKEAARENVHQIKLCESEIKAIKAAAGARAKPIEARPKEKR